MSRTTDWVIDQMNEAAHTPRCFSRHMGLWAMTEYHLARWPLWYAALHALRNGQPLPSTEAARRDRNRGEDEPAYQVENGTAIISISGPMMKGESKFGGANTVAIRQALREAKADDAVKRVMLSIDSPGGSVAGTDALARDVAALNLVKPVHAHIDDLGASAAYWVASQAKKITAGPSAEVGSIGVYAVVEDTSQRAAMDGVKIHVISTGPYKGALEDGTEVTDTQLAYVRERVEDMNNHFQSAIVRGRGDRMTKENLAEASDGRVFSAGESRKMGLVDRVMSFEESLAAMQPKRIISQRAAAARAAIQRLLTR